MAIDRSEQAIQDGLADRYHRVNYSHPHFLEYSGWVSQALVSSIDWDSKDSWAVLDDGCGIGYMAGWLKRRYGVKVTVYGLDLSMNMLKVASGGKSGFFCQGNGEELPFKDKAFDVVFARGLLHHLPAPGRGLGEIHRVLKGGGFFCGMDPNRGLFPSFIRRTFQGGGEFSRTHREFDSREYAKLVEGGFQILSFRHFGYFAYLLMAAVGVFDFLSLLHVPLAFTRFLIAVDDRLLAASPLRKQGFGFVITALKRHWK